MANYIKQSLEEGEEIVLKGRLHWTSVWGYYFWSILFIIGSIGCIVGTQFVTPEQAPYLYWAAPVIFVLALLIWFIGHLFRTRSEFAVTTNRFIQKDGILNIKMTEIPLFKIETVNFYQSIWQRIFRTGCIELVGSGGTSHQVHFIEHPMHVRKVICAAIRPDNEIPKPKIEEEQQSVPTIQTVES